MSNNESREELHNKDKCRRRPEETNPCYKVFPHIVYIYEMNNYFSFIIFLYQTFI